MHTCLFTSHFTLQCAPSTPRFPPITRIFPAELPATPPYAQRHKMRVLSLLYRKGKKGRAASPERYRFFILIINFKIKQT